MRQDDWAVRSACLASVRDLRRRTTAIAQPTSLGEPAPIRQRALLCFWPSSASWYPTTGQTESTLPSTAPPSPPVAPLAAAHAHPHLPVRASPQPPSLAPLATPCIAHAGPPPLMTTEEATCCVAHMPTSLAPSSEQTASSNVSNGGTPSRERPPDKPSREGRRERDTAGTWSEQASEVASKAAALCCRLRLRGALCCRFRTRRSGREELTRPGVLTGLRWPETLRPLPAARHSCRKSRVAARTWCTGGCGVRRGGQSWRPLTETFRPAPYECSGRLKATGALASAGLSVLRDMRGGADGGCAAQTPPQAQDKRTLPIARPRPQCHPGRSRRGSALD